MCSSNRTMVATGSSGARAVISSGSMVGAPTSRKPLGTVDKILIGAVFLWRQYNQDAMVSMMTANPLLRTEMKKKTRADRTSCQHRRHFAFKY